VNSLVVIPISRLPHVPIPETQEVYCLWIDEDEKVVVFVCEEIEEAA
jgi:hypothetical protein